ARITVVLATGRPGRGGRTREVQVSGSNRKGERSTPGRGLAALIVAALALGVAALAAGVNLLRTGHVRAARVPVAQTLPRISGIPQVGVLLRASHGKWSGSPTSYASHWKRCDAAGRKCKAISGVTSQTYRHEGDDIGRTLRVSVTAANPAGHSKAALSLATAVATGSSTIRHLEYVLGSGVVHVYSIDNGFAEVESFSLPDSAGVRGVDECPAVPRLRRSGRRQQRRRARLQPA